ncbi:MAG: hypothetical protein P4M07_28895 [Xanthobacteraceae bacterium]|nr:hypothetical protein [Xanthobacteraceae bacterium]
MKRTSLFVAVALASSALGWGSTGPARAEFLLPFFPTPLVPSRPPLAFGMSPDDVAAALQTSLVYVSGSRGNEIFVATLPGEALFPRGDRLFVKFRKGQLSGWKGDWTIAWVGP